MSKEEFCERYGTKNSKPKQLYNRAIRDEYVWGNDLLDLLALVSSMRQRARDDEESDKLVTIEDRLQEIRDLMAADVQKRWGC
ncbi:MAG: hypothetical protein FWD79_11550 [Desulfobulbus sp.]|nr:hypothetical protein [Desulfobulbus sp.]